MVVGVGMKDNGLLIAAGVLLLLLIIGGGGYVVYTNYKQRGIRNNNPGNLRISNNAWKGKVPKAENKDGTFEQFREFAGKPGHIWGLRAMYIDIRGDVLADGLNTLRKLITSYAPGHENNTPAYIAAMSKAIGKGADAVLTLDDVKKLVPAITQHENGVQPYPAKDIALAISLA